MARISRPLLIALLLLVGGCGNPDGRKPVFPVEGRLTYQNQPMAGAMVGFHPLDDPSPRALRSMATADAEGRYRMTTYVTGDGVPAGEFAVTVYWPGKRAGKPKSADEEEEPAPDRLQRAYLDPAKTRLRASVREQSNVVNFNLP